MPTSLTSHTLHITLRRLQQEEARLRSIRRPAQVVLDIVDKMIQDRQVRQGLRMHNTLQKGVRSLPQMMSMLRRQITLLQGLVFALENSQEVGVLLRPENLRRITQLLSLTVAQLGASDMSRIGKELDEILHLLSEPGLHPTAGPQRVCGACSGRGYHCDARRLARALCRHRCPRTAQHGWTARILCAADTQKNRHWWKARACTCCVMSM